MRNFLLLFLIVPSLTLAINTISFPNHCAVGKKLMIAAVGDVLLHTPLQIQAQKKGYESLWHEAIPYIKNADIAYANVEGAIALSNEHAYTGFPRFNYHPELAYALKSSGFDIVSSANNHILDASKAGVYKTLNSLKSAKLPTTGIRVENDNTSWFQIIEKNGFKIAWIACTEHTNGNIDRSHQILHCYKTQDKEWIINKIKQLKTQVNAIIITPHWGEESQISPDNVQTNFAKEVLDAGAIAVIGSHPHVLQPLKQYITKDGRTTLIMYSLGNFVSNQGTPRNRTTIILLIGLTQTSNGTIINTVKFVPMYMQNRNGYLNNTLTRVDNKNSFAYQIIAQVLPIGNITNGTALTSPECTSSN